MTATTTTPSVSPVTTSAPAPSPARRKFPLVLVTNLCAAFLLLGALPIIYNGQQGFVPHAVVNKEYVNVAIASGEADFMHKALKTTEIARAMAYDDHLATMSVMQAAVGVLAVLFLLNSYFLFRMHRQPELARTPRDS